MDLTVGVAVRGQPGRGVNRPHGSGDYVFVNFLAAAYLGADHDVSVGRGDCILWRPDTPTFITSPTTIYNHYVHLSGDLFEPALDRYDVPTDQVLRPDSVQFVRPLLTRMQREWVRRDAHWTRALELLVEELLIFLARATPEAVPTPTSSHDGRLRDIRLQVHRDLTYPWTVARMADLDRKSVV